jgi:hypothetical protein
MWAGGDYEARSPETDKADRIVWDAVLRGEIDEAHSEILDVG